LFYAPIPKKKRTSPREDLNRPGMCPLQLIKRALVLKSITYICVRFELKREKSAPLNQATLHTKRYGRYVFFTNRSAMVI
jgi:hypothetical protein